MKILVTGANGYLGQGVVKALLDNGHSVVAADFKTNYVNKRRIHNVISFRGGHSEWNSGLQVHYKRICRFAPVDVLTLNIKITASRTEPTLRLLEVYQ